MEEKVNSSKAYRYAIVGSLIGVFISVTLIVISVGIKVTAFQ